MTGARGLVIAAIALAMLVAVPLWAGPYLTTLMFVMLIAYIVAQSWDWIGGEAGYINLAHYAFFGIGAYAFALLLVRETPLIVSLAAAFVVPMIAAVILAFPFFRLRGDYFAFATLAFMPLIEILAFNLVPITRGADGVVLPPAYVLYEAYAIALPIAALTLAATVWLNKIPLGYALKSVRNDEQAAETVGIRIFPAKTKALALSAGFAGIAGGVQAWQLSYIDPPSVFGLDIALIPVAMALLGGSGLLWGPIVGVIILSALQQLLVVNLSMLQATIYGGLILVIGRFMPGGLLRAAWVRNLPWIGRLSLEHHERARATLGRHAAAETALPLPRVTANRARILLDCRAVTMAFGGNVAVDGVDLAVREGEIVGLVGPNGSGKTTLFNCISKIFEPQGGEIVFAGRNLKAMRRDAIAHLGIGRTYQIPRPFSDLTVRENIAVSLMFRAEGASALLAALAEAEPFAAYVGLAPRLDARADALNLQQKKALELGRALACRPKLLLVDEVASGLTPTEVRAFVAQLRELRDVHGITVIWVEHIFSALAQVVDRIVVLEQGRVIADGPLAEVVRNERVLKTYLGHSAREVA